MDYDFIIIGAGVIGTSVACYLQKSSPNRKVLLIEKEKRVAAGNTGKSAALYRNIFSSPTAKKLAKGTIHYLKTIKSEVHLDPIGYLWLFSTNRWEAAKAAMQSLDPIADQIEFMMGTEIQRRININTQGRMMFPDIYAGMFGHMCGSLSAMSLAKHYLKEFVAAGGEVKFETEVKEFLLSGAESGYAPWDNVQVIGVKDQNEEVYVAGHIIVATGAWTHQLLSELGIFSSVLPKKRQLFGVNVEDPSIFVPEGGKLELPAIILPAGEMYVKPLLKRKLILVGASNDLGEPFNMSNPEPSVEYFSSAIVPALNHYFPTLWAPELIQMWAGYYAYHWPDKNPVVETMSNLTWVSGTSGSGIMKSDAIGRIVTAKVTGEQAAKLSDGTVMEVSELSLVEREVGKERFIL